jgi:hypothetical protein
VIAGTARLVGDGIGGVWWPLLSSVGSGEGGRASGA